MATTLTIREIPLHELVLDPNLNLRDRLDQDTVERYMDAWNRMPPVTVFEVDGQLLLADGFHRHAAAVTLGRRTLPAEVRPGTMDEALDYVSGANLHHGLPLTRAERRRAIELKLRLHHERSDRHLAEELLVGRELIAKVRRQLVEGGQIPAGSVRIGADGKSYPSLPKDPNERLPKGRALAQQDDPRDRGGREADGWDDTTDPMPPVVNEGPPRAKAAPPWEEAPDARTAALAPPIQPSAPTIDEMLNLMTQQIMEVISWTNAEGFAEAYKTAGANTRGLFQTAALKLAARADQLRKG
jgi:ParB-like chromosome segregation protein Spo0J